MLIHFCVGEEENEKTPSQTIMNADKLDIEENIDFETGGVCHVEIILSDKVVIVYTGDGHWYLTFTLQEWFSMLGTVEIVD